MTSRQFIVYLRKRLKNGETVAGIAKDFDVTRQSIYFWLAGKGPTKPTLQLAEAKKSAAMGERA